MMSKTHITVGIAAAMAAYCPSDYAGILVSVVGGAIGGVLCDIECKSTPHNRDALTGRIIVAGITGATILADGLLKTGIWNRIMSQENYYLITGVIVLLVTCIMGRRSEHRTFSHSLLYVALITVGFFCILPELALPVLAGGLSHLAIDTLNKKPVPWLYPFRKKGICFRLCYASKIGNSILMWIGLILSITLLGWRIATINSIM